jgi:hypothetical protein
MVTIPKIRTRLLQGFPEPQADLLAHVFVESYDELVTKAELNELTGVVNNLAHSVQDLADAQQELTQSQQELADAQQELAHAQKRTEWAMADLTKQVGGLANALGGSIEDFACDLVPELLEKYWDMQIDSAHSEEIMVGNRQREIDVVVRGTIASKPVLVLCEAKANISPTEVQRFLKTVDKVRSARPTEDIRPLFFGYKANRTARELIVNSGAAMVFTRGVMIPEQDRAA